jgi:hypothetical protein
MPTTRFRAPAVAWLLPLALATAPALAQTPPAEPPPPGMAAPPEKVEPGPPIGSPGSGESLSEELSRSQGVLTPPQGIDPGLVEEPPVPPGATPMPVIPPPGSPGGNPDVQPK